MSLAASIAALVKGNPGQMTPAEYAAVAQEILDRRPRHLLVFGCGRDSPLWAGLAPPGAVVLFVEDDAHWAPDAPAPVLLTRYAGTVADWERRDPLTAMDCWPVLGFIPWDLVLVDGPRGDNPARPGRLGPIAFSAGLKRATVLVHDAHRPAESGMCARYFPGRKSRDVHHLRIFAPAPLPPQET